MIDKAIGSLKLNFFNNLDSICNDLNHEPYDTACFIFLGRYLKTLNSEVKINPSENLSQSEKLIYLSKVSNIDIRKIPVHSINYKIKTPLILKLKNGDFQVVLSIKSKYCLIFDKNEGIIKKNIPDNICEAFEVYKSTSFQKNNNKLNLWKLFLNVEKIKSFLTKLIALSILKICHAVILRILVN
ncbi:hypothetical protein [Photorhabdus tasmaniensis]|uniref:Peptidase C39 domain-containing protein n=1 Tax=Photorhabdus tasmaniensis TaxID=1004159 RepID=A0ABX0GCW2_9GAMM|nr:hypothetical protein [Photorhabdus tasmaniensis]NHB86890.1 hypothetical protein [Photorhabdus tasmaniensis]